jgi:hypothetical protein
MPAMKKTGINGNKGGSELEGNQRVRFEVALLNAPTVAAGLPIWPRR